MKDFLKHKKVGAIVAAGLIGTGSMAAALASIGVQSSSAASGVVLTMESSPTNTLTRSFNPFSTTDAIYLVAGTSFVYEPLLQFDAAKAGVIYPWLATGYKFTNGGKSVVFTIRKGAKWSDGSPLTPADVAFTYELVKKNPAINTGGLAITKVATAGDTVTISFATPQYTNLQNIASVYIVPKKIWSGVGNPATYVDPNPVGSGPYTVGTFTPQGFTLVKNPNYWAASKVRIPTLDFPAYASNTNAEEALFSGQLDWAGNFIPNLKKLFLSKSKLNTAWEAPLNTVTLEPNLNRFPLNQLPVRQAISLAVDRQAISTQGEAGLEPPAVNASGITLPVFNAYLSPAVAGAKLAPTANVSAAKAVLEKAGWKMGSNGYFQKNGKTLTFSISDPSSYTDYAADASIIASDLKKAGMDVTFNGLTVTAWSNDVADGNFDSVIHWSNGGVNPYSMFNGWLNSTLDTKSASGDYEHLHDAAINAQLNKVAAAPTLAAEKAALAPIEKYMATNLPLIPLVYGVAWSEVNGQHIKGWPTPANPYESAQPATPTNEVVVLHLSPRG
ncbi:MAG: ABC transporter substrate-binding protein [Actinomycetota bacterium]|nr:ABC transporter substrate-binding protein [Actinomycetota bacterium]